MHAISSKFQIENCFYAVWQVRVAALKRSASACSPFEFGVETMRLSSLAISINLIWAWGS